MEREVGGGIGMGNTCKPLAVSSQCMTKSTTNKKKKKKRKSPLDEWSPASGLKVMDPETQILQEHGCRTLVLLTQKSFTQRGETTLRDRHSDPE